MQRVSRQEELTRQFFGPARLDKTKIELLVRPIEFVADDRMTEVREVNPDLVRPPGARDGPDDRKLISPVAWPNESFFNPKLRHGGRAFLVNRLFQPNGGRPMRALPRERRVHGRGFPGRPAAHDGEVFLRNELSLHGETEATRGGGVLRDQDEAARLAVESVHDGNLPAIHELEGEQ